MEILRVTLLMMHIHAYRVSTEQGDCPSAISNPRFKFHTVRWQKADDLCSPIRFIKFLISDSRKGRRKAPFVKIK